MEKAEDKLTENDFLNVLWNYFSLHANQRMQLLHFYILLETFVITGLLTIFQLNGEFKIFRILLSVAIIFFSIVFKGLDKRAKEMIKYSENAIRYLEKKYILKYNGDIMIFCIEEEKTAYERRKNWCKKFFLSYSKLFNLIYFFFIAIGFVCMVISSIRT